MLDEYTPKVIARFFSKVKKTDTCWLWQAGKNDQGYGRFCVEANNRLAHRASWEMHNGPIPDGKKVLHACDNPPCVNPAHLFLGTQKDNMQDAINKGRFVFLTHLGGLTAHCKRGHEWTPENTHIYFADNHIHRRCRLCTAMNARHRRAKRKNNES